MYRYILANLCSQFDSLPLTSLTRSTHDVSHRGQRDGHRCVDWTVGRVLARSGNVRAQHPHELVARSRVRTGRDVAKRRRSVLPRLRNGRDVERWATPQLLRNECVEAQPRVVGLERGGECAPRNSERRPQRVRWTPRACKRNDSEAAPGHQRALHRRRYGRDGRIRANTSLAMVESHGFGLYVVHFFCFFCVSSFLLFAHLFLLCTADALAPNSVARGAPIGINATDVTQIGLDLPNWPFDPAAMFARDASAKIEVETPDRVFGLYGEPAFGISFPLTPGVLPPLNDANVAIFNRVDFNPSASSSTEQRAGGLARGASAAAASPTVTMRLCTPLASANITAATSVTLRESAPDGPLVATIPLSETSTARGGCGYLTGGYVRCCSCSYSCSCSCSSCSCSSRACSRSRSSRAAFSAVPPSAPAHTHAHARAHTLNNVFFPSFFPRSFFSFLHQTRSHACKRRSLFVLHRPPAETRTMQWAPGTLNDSPDAMVQIEVPLEKMFTPAGRKNIFLSVNGGGVAAIDWFWFNF